MLNKLRIAIENDLEASEEQRKFGTGWISGVIALIISISAFLLLLSQQYRAFFSVDDLEKLHSSSSYDLLIQAFILVAFMLACTNLVLRRNKILGFSAIIFVILTNIFGFFGAIGQTDGGPNLGIDWFILNLLLKGFLFVPLEKIFSKTNKQPLFREDWREDLFYFLISSLFVQSLAMISLWPTNQIIKHAHLWQNFRDIIAAQPQILQFIEIMILADLMQYSFHRLFHQIPFLWKFHAVHHSARVMDWMAGSRMHIFEIIALRAVTIIPLYALGFSTFTLYIYIFFVYLVSTWVHANVRFNDEWLAKYFVTPRFHHWHHGIEDEAIDVNFSVHFPWIDKIFGTYYLPKNEWPSGYGIKNHPVPNGYLKQFMYPFKATKE